MVLNMGMETNRTAASTVPFEGGTARLIQGAATTRPGWGIAVYEWVTYRGNVRYFVARTNRTTFFRLSEAFTTEAEARSQANAEYRAEIGRPRPSEQMLCA